MAQLKTDSSGRQYVLVEKGDCLTQIAVDYAGGYSNYKKLQSINNISNPDLIYIGQKIYLTSSGSSSSTTKSSALKATINQFGLQSDKDNTLFASWSWTKPDSETDSYQVKWEYYVKTPSSGGIWFVGTSSKNSVDENDPSVSRWSTFTIPDGAEQIRFKVKPISKKKTVNKKETVYWTAEWSDTKTHTNDPTPPQTPTGLKVEIKDNRLTATLDGLENINAPKIEFEIIESDKTVYKSGKESTVSIKYGSVSYSCDVKPGNTYKVRCRSVDGKVYSDWCGYVDAGSSSPSAPSGIDKLEAKTETSVLLTWKTVNTAVKYIIQYTTEKDYFDNSNLPQEVQTNEVAQSEKTTSWLVTGLSSGEEYFFRIRAVTKDGFESGWSAISSVVVGKKPAAPTTWSSTTTAVAEAGSKVILYWVHNSEDNSKLSKAVLKLIIGGDETTKEFTYDPDKEDEEETIRTYELDVSSFTAGTVIRWQVQTYGVVDEPSVWSTLRTITVNARPSLIIQVGTKDMDDNFIKTSTLSSLPLVVKMESGPASQKAIGYQLVVKANEAYETTDSVGNPVFVNENEEIYSKYFDVDGLEHMVVLSANHITLENGIEYTVLCNVTMDTGLSAEATGGFEVTWADISYEPNAEVGIDTETLVAHVRPYCEDTTLKYYEVEKSGTNTYTRTTNEIGFVHGTVVTYVQNRVKYAAKTTGGDTVYEGVTADGDEVQYCIVYEKTPVDNVVLSVYRREFDGTFTELATEIDGSGTTYITDPHPALDYARYRIVATSTETGNVSYYDVPGVPVGEKAAVIQWAETWSNFDAVSDDELSKPAWSGSLLKLPYNLDVSDKYGPEVSLVEYIGRAHPVSYYGTQLGETSSWSMVIPKSDRETLYGLRRLATWLGDVYVREPSGSGYWAHVVVNFSQKHKAVTIPVTLDIKRVEGGA